MKKYLCLLLAALLMLALCACGETSPSYTAVPSGDVQFVSCQFAQEIRAADGEVKTQFYQQVEGKIYVDLRFSVTNCSASPIGKEDFSATLHYHDTLIPMQYCRETESATAVNEDAVSVGEHGNVHMFTLIPKEAVDDDLSVSYQVGGKTYWTKVEKTQTPLPMTGKTRLNVGDKVQIPYVDCELKVLEAGVVEQLQASKQTESFYPGPYVLVKLQLTSNHGMIKISDVYAHTVIKEEQISLHVETENVQGTDLVAFSQLEPGRTTQLYLFAKLDEGETLNDDIVRFNIAGSCYYVRIK